MDVGGEKGGKGRGGSGTFCGTSTQVHVHILVSLFTVSGRARRRGQC